MTQKKNPKETNEFALVPFVREKHGFLSSVIKGMTDVDLADKKEAVQARMQELVQLPVSAAYITCAGMNCPFRKKCPLSLEGVELPVGKRCPVEHSYLVARLYKWFEAFDVNPDNPIEAGDVALCETLAEIDLFEWRISAQLSSVSEATLQEEFVVGVSNDGTPLYKKGISTLFSLQEKLIELRRRTLKELIGTRREKSIQKVLSADSRDIASQYAKVRAILEEGGE